MHIKYFYSALLALAILSGCKKDPPADPVPDPINNYDLKGIWKVDSTIIQSYQDNVPGPLLQLEESPYTVTFDATTALFRKSNPIDTTSYLQYNTDKIVLDLNDDEAQDSCSVTIVTAQKNVNISGRVEKYMSGNVEFKTVHTIFLTKQ